MSAHPGTMLPKQVYDPINKSKSGSILEPHQNGCPIAKEITHRLQIPAVVGSYESIDVGGVCLSRDDFCLESVHCVLCSFVAKARPAGTNSASRGSVYFVLDESTNSRLRRWMYTRSPPLDNRETSDLTIAVTSGANVFQTVYWFRNEDSDFEISAHDSECGILGTLRLWKYETPNHKLPKPKLDTLTYIAKQAKQWLSLCDARHEACRSLDSNFTPPISLIDCNRHCLVHGFPGIRYIALSYVWGKTGRDFNLPERKYEVPLDGLPRTIRDAITVTKSLEYDYLWVDMLCIDQQSKEDKHRQIAIMDQVYRSADLTIIVAAGSDCGSGIPGVGEICRPPRMSITIGNTMLVEEKGDAINEIEASIWRSRGWTFQEGLLSRRRLVFTDSQMLFSCLCSQLTEPREGPEFSHNAGEADTHWSSRLSILSLIRKDTLWDTGFLQTDRKPRTTLIKIPDYSWSYESLLGYGFPISFAELLEKYSKLHFSFESDIVDAFRAIGNTFAQRKPPVLHLYGLPFISDDESMTASSITRGLAWCLERGNEETARRPDFPSWSWLGYRGPVRWGALLRAGPTESINRQWSAKTFSHVSSMITISNRRFELLQLSQWWREWSSGNASEGLAPSRLMIQGAMIKRRIWLGAKCTKKTPRDESARFIIEGKGGWLSDIEYSVGDGLMMSADACQCLLENLRRGSWMALLLTDNFLLIIQSVAAGAKVGSYRRVASADINVFHNRKYHRMERDGFVKEYTELVDGEDASALD
ncbi:hypothetical protein PG995_000002 [Apiospora arundinis]